VECRAGASGRRARRRKRPSTRGLAALAAHTGLALAATAVSIALARARWGVATDSLGPAGVAAPGGERRAATSGGGAAEARPGDTRDAGPVEDGGHRARLVTALGVRGARGAGRVAADLLVSQVAGAAAACAAVGGRRSGRSARRQCRDAREPPAFGALTTVGVHAASVALRRAGASGLRAFRWLAAVARGAVAVLGTRRAHRRRRRRGRGAASGGDDAYADTDEYGGVAPQAPSLAIRIGHSSSMRRRPLRRLDVPVRVEPMALRPSLRRSRPRQGAGPGSRGRRRDR
jgi:hypothetical protein